MFPMDTVRIATLLEPFLEQALPQAKLDQISIYIDLLRRWNARINLTAIRQEEEIVTRHFGESLFMARHLFPTSAAREPSSATSGRAQTTSVNPPHVLDIGSGAGFPALPLKLWAPHIHLTLIESNHKKAAFLREVARKLTLTNINVIADRIETLAVRPSFARTDIVTLRAVERFDTILPQATAFLSRNATLALLIGVAQVPLLTALTNLTWQKPIPVPMSQARVLSIGVILESGNSTYSHT